MIYNLLIFIDLNLFINDYKYKIKLNSEEQSAKTIQLIPHDLLPCLFTVETKQHFQRFSNQ
jgi:hypothetical protein